jgi:YHS domain-containing protein
MATAIDPVCGFNVIMEVARDDGLITTYKDQTFYFDSEECKQAFLKDPDTALFHHALRMAAQTNKEMSEGVQPDQPTKPQSAQTS